MRAVGRAVVADAARAVGLAAVVVMRAAEAAVRAGREAMAVAARVAVAGLAA